MENKMFPILILFVLFSSTFMESNIETAQAAETISITLDKNSVNRSMKWQNSKSYRFLTDSWVGKFPKTIEYNKDGYRGTLIGKTMILTPANRITDRKVTLSHTWTDSTYRVRQSDVPEPSSVKKNYTDSASKTIIEKNVPKSGGLKSVGSKSVKVYSSSNGKAENYDGNNNTTLGYMSYNTSTYYGGAYSYSSPPRPPNDYYGPDASEFGSTGWTLEDISWAECCVRDAKDPRWHYKTARFGYMWRSDAGNLNRYRKGVYLTYSKFVTGHKYKQDYRQT